MIDFRYHVVSIVAVFLALALGLFLGSTTLQDTVVHSLKKTSDKVTRDNAALETQLHDTQNQLKANQSFDDALLPTAVANRLTGQSIAVVSAPGADDSTRKQLFATLAAAGATVSADVRVQSGLVDPEKDSFIVSLAEHVSVPVDPDPTATSGAARAASQLAAVLGQHPPERVVPPTTVQTVLATYTAAKLVSIGKTQTDPRPGTLAVVLAGPAYPATADPAQVSANQSVVVDLLRDLDAAALGAVLAAPTPAANTLPDAVASAAATKGLTSRASTVTGIDTSAGQIATVYALAAQLTGGAGQFGLVGKGSPLPSPSASP